MGLGFVDMKVIDRNSFPYRQCREAAQQKARGVSKMVWSDWTVFQWVKQVASHFGGTAQGVAMSWPGHI